MKPIPFAFSFWLRVYGVGIYIHNGQKLWTERSRRVIRIFGVAFEWLRRPG